MTGVCFVLAETDSGSQGDLTQWCDEAAGSMRAHPSVRQLQRYMAFNARRCVAIATLAEGSDRQPALPNNPAIRHEILDGKTVSEFARPNEGAMQLASILYSVRFAVPPDAAPEFDAWYDSEHIPMMMESPGWAGVTRYHVQNNTWTHLCLHYIRDAGAIDSPALRAARSTPGRAYFAAKSWLSGFDKMYYFRLQPPT